MTELLERAIQAATMQSPAAQDEIARVVLRLTGEVEAGPVALLSAEEREAIAISKAAAARGEFASETQVRAIWAKYGL
jgi:hypothetical protein